MEDVLREWGAVEVSAMDVYSDIFRLGDGLIQREGEPPGSHKANPIIIGQKGSEVRRRIMFEDTFEELLTEFQGFDWAFLNGLTYWGRSNIAASQSKMHAMIFDLDGVTPTTLNNFFSGAFRAQAYPIPQYVILSGHGVHLYYVLEEPVSLYPAAKTQLKQLKYALTDKIWNRYTSKEKKVQHQGINQGFRIIGGKTKDGDARVRAFRVDQHPTTIEELNSFVPEDKRVDESAAYGPTRMTLDKARELYPGWYERRVLGKESKGKWHVKRDLYDWWKRQIESGATYGHRYFCVMCLAIYGVKCDIDPEEVRRDALALIPFLNEINPGEPFTEVDVKSALECLDERYSTFPRDDISKLSGITLVANKRNGRKQDVHLMGARAIQEINDRVNGTNWRNTAGAPTKEQIIRDYAAANPEASHSKIAKDLGVSRKTVIKWLKG